MYPEKDVKKLHISPYLSEGRLSDVIQFVFETEATKQRQVTVPDAGRLRVDASFSLPSGQDVFVEFNGPTHYTSTKVIQRDYALRRFCAEGNIRLVEIPYFVQINNYSVEKLFGQAVSTFMSGKVITSATQSGFIVRPIVMPYDFCLLGIGRFTKDLLPDASVQNGDQLDVGAEFWGISVDIWQSLRPGYLSDKEYSLLQAALSASETYTDSIGQLLSNFPT